MSSRKLSELIDTHGSAWNLIKEWIKAARNKIEILPSDRTQSESTLFQLQITTRSPMGAVALETGGILIDHGWLRFLGSGNIRMTEGLLSWNGLTNNSLITPIKGAFVVAHDAVGGFFAINGGAFPGPMKNIYYLAPDTLVWENLDRTYSDLLNWAFHGNLEKFYQNARWMEWQSDMLNLTGDQGILIYPPLWAEGLSVTERQRKIVPMYELWTLHSQGLPKQKN